MIDATAQFTPLLLFGRSINEYPPYGRILSIVQDVTHLADVHGVFCAIKTNEYYCILTLLCFDHT